MSLDRRPLLLGRRRHWNINRDILVAVVAITYMEYMVSTSICAAFREETYLCLSPSAFWAQMAQEHQPRHSRRGHCYHLHGVQAFARCLEKKRTASTGLVKFNFTCWQQTTTMSKYVVSTSIYTIWGRNAPLFVTLRFLGAEGTGISTAPFSLRLLLSPMWNLW